MGRGPDQRGESTEMAPFLGYAMTRGTVADSSSLFSQQLRTMIILATFSGWRIGKTRPLPHWRKRECIECPMNGGLL